MQYIFSNKYTAYIFYLLISIHWLNSEVCICVVLDCQVKLLQTHFNLLINVRELNYEVCVCVALQCHANIKQNYFEFLIHINVLDDYQIIHTKSVSYNC